jgi:hypothetical protein
VRDSGKTLLYSIFQLWAASSFAVIAAALDVPVDADLLKVRETARGAAVLFVSHDPDVPFPAPGSGEDPSTPSGRLSFDLFARSASPSHVELPVATGTPGWRFVDGKVDRYLFRNSNAPDAFSDLEKVVIRDGRVLQVSGFLPGLSLGSPLGPSAVRIQTGANRVCAVFLADDVRRDDPDRYVARAAKAANLDDCSDAAILEAIFGVAPTPSPSPTPGPSPTPSPAPCGGSPELPQCDGTCQAGQICGVTFSPQISCVCVEASVPCEDATFPTCGGTCPAGGICSIDVSNAGCRCISASEPCGDTYPRCGGECPAGEECSPRSGGGPFDYCACAPVGVTPCGALGGFPACDQECPDAGDSCIPLDSTGGPGCTRHSYCGCVPPDRPCGQDGMAGICPPGMNCVSSFSEWYCSTEPPFCP